MKVRVEHGLFDCGDLDAYRALRRLFELASIEKHEIHLDDPDELFESDFFRSACAEIDRVEWEELMGRVASEERFESSAERMSRRCALVSSGTRERTADVVIVPIGSLRWWVEQPLRILLENQRDGVLARLAARVAASHRLTRALDERWILLDGCGGCGEVLNAVMRAEPHERIFVIVDSDREESGGDESNTAKKIAKAAAERGIDVHVLKRRELENYVPDSIWELTIGNPRRSRGRAKSTNPRAVRLYRWILGQMEANRASLEARHSKSAVDQVVARLRREAQKEVSEKSWRDALDERRRMPAADRDVDDLKVRFGEQVAEKAVERMSEEAFDHSWLDEGARRELEAIAREIDGWL